MNKAADFSKKLELAGVAGAEKLIEKTCRAAIAVQDLNEVLCIMHSDGSVSLTGHMGGGVWTTEVISAPNILKVLQHYRPFKEVFTRNVN